MVKTKYITIIVLACMLFLATVNCQERQKIDTQNTTKTLRVIYSSEDGLKLSHEDSLFMKKYNVRYEGVRIPDIGNGYMINYQEDLNNYEDMDEIYGEQWRKEVNKNVIGLKTFIQETSKINREKGIFKNADYFLWLENKPKGCF